MQQRGVETLTQTIYLEAIMEVDRTNSMGLWTQSHEFYRAACLVVESEKLELSDPAYYLTLHSIELGLKAYLRGNGVSLDELKKTLGHDLKKCLDRAVEFGLSAHYKLTKEDVSAIEAINRYYHTKDFEYILTGYKKYPEIKALISFNKHLLEATRTFCYERMHCNESKSEKQSKL